MSTHTVILSAAIVTSVITCAAAVLTLRTGDTHPTVLTNGLMTVTIILWFAAVSHRDKATLAREMREMRVERVVRALRQPDEPRARRHGR